MSRYLKKPGYSPTLTVIVVAAALSLWRCQVLKDGQSELSQIDADSFVMGDALDGIPNARPHPVVLEEFHIARHEVTLELWQRVQGRAKTHGYADLPAGMGKKENHPVYAVSWYDAVKWCNARSEMEGLTPCYHMDEGRREVYREGLSDLSAESTLWDATGYRLPTEAEWEAAARGGLSGRRYPWGDTATHAEANYVSKADIAHDISPTRGTAPAYQGSLPYTAPVGSHPPNDFGLYDVAGNVLEWCWDKYEKNYGLPWLAASSGTGMPKESVENPHGPETGDSRLVRGGSWRHDAEEMRCASRYDLPPQMLAPHIGLRLVRSRL